MPLGPANSTKLLTNSKTILYFINLLFVRKQSNGNDNVITTIFSTHYLRFNSITDSCGQLFYSNAKIFIALQWKVATSLILLPKRLPIREEILKNSFLHVNNHTITLVYKKIGFWKCKTSIRLLLWFQSPLGSFWVLLRQVGIYFELILM